MNFTAADRVGSIGGYIGGAGQLANMLFGGGAGNGDGGGITNILGTRTYAPGHQYVTEREVAYIREISEKDAIIAKQAAEKYADDKVAVLAGRVCELEKNEAVTAVELRDQKVFNEVRYVHQPRARFRGRVVECEDECCCCGGGRHRRSHGEDCGD